VSRGDDRGLDFRFILELDLGALHELLPLALKELDRSGS
jgi:hypothetical protein